MPDKKIDSVSREEDNGFAKKKRKGIVLPFILCLLIAIVIWLYASNEEDEMNRENDSESSVSAKIEFRCDSEIL